MMTTVIASLCHIKLVQERGHFFNRNHREKSVDNCKVYLITDIMNLGKLPRVGRHFLSGYIFGMLALNTKLTNLALLPFLFFWSMVQLSKKLAPKPFNLLSWHFFLISSILLCALSFGVFCGYAPWMYYYWVSFIP